MCCTAKMMKVLFLLERVYGITGVRFRPHDCGPWSKEVEGALERLARLGLVEEVEPPEGAFCASTASLRRDVVEKIPIKDPKNFPTLMSSSSWGGTTSRNT